MKFFLLFLCTLSQVWGISETNYEETYKSSVLAYFETANQQKFINAQGLELNYYVFKNPVNTKTLVILPGRTEPAKKYAEIIFDLKDQGLDIFILDHQGQGESVRRLKDSHKGYVRKFSHYVDDLTLWMKEVVLPESKSTRHLLTHSMGGAIGVHYLANHPHVFQKAILVAPMLQINTKPYKEEVGRLLANTLTGIGLGTTYAPGRGPYRPDEDTFEKNEVTSSQARFAMTKNLFLENPEMILGGPTTRWVRESLQATKNIDELATRISTPINLLQAQKDLIVELPRQNAFCQKATSCTLIGFPEARHEILMESDPIRDEALRIILDTFSE
jgi:lysophospholipase